MFKLIGKLTLGTIGLGTIMAVGVGTGIAITGLALTDNTEYGDEVRKCIEELGKRRKELKEEKKQKEESNHAFDDILKQFNESFQKVTEETTAYPPEKILKKFDLTY